MNEQQERALADGLKALAATSRHASAGARVEAAVLAEMRRAAAPPPMGRAWLPLAAALIIASVSGVWLARQSAPEPQTFIRPSGFVQIPGTWALPPLESGSIVRVEVDVAELPSYGIQIVPEIGPGPVEAELLVAQDGHARAIRLVHETDSRSTP